MAAVLCKGMSDLCSGCGSAIGQVVCLPCKACGMGCSSLGEVLTSPFFPYLALTFGLNLPGLFYGIKSLTSDCPDLSTWLLVNGVLCVMHMLAAWYIVNKIRQSSNDHDNTTPIKQASDNEAPTSNFQNFHSSNENAGAANSFLRIKHVLCNDKGMAVYIIGFIGWMVWLFMGIGKRLTAEDNGGCEGEIQGMNVAIGCGYMYLSMVFMAFGCSLCCIR